MSNNFIGQGGFNWFMGIVENSLDPLKLKRSRVRMFGIHSHDKSIIPHEDLPWAQNATNIIHKPGDFVVGFFLDGSSQQHPVIIGSLPGIPEVLPNQQLGFNEQRSNTELSLSPSLIGSQVGNTAGFGTFCVNADSLLYPYYTNEPSTNRFMRGEFINSIPLTNIKANNFVSSIKNTTWGEPLPIANTLYPYNDAKYTQSGHLMEMDDTKGAERVHIAHRTGSFQEYRPDGSVVNKSVNDRHDFVHKDDYKYVMGSQSQVVQGSKNEYIQGLNITTIDGISTLNVTGVLNINAKAGIVIDSPTITLTGSLTSKGDQVAGGISQINHKHLGVTSGSQITGIPVGSSGGSGSSDAEVGSEILGIYTD